MTVTRQRLGDNDFGTFHFQPWVAPPSAAVCFMSNCDGDRCYVAGSLQTEEHSEEPESPEPEPGPQFTTPALNPSAPITSRLLAARPAACSCSPPCRSLPGCPRAPGPA